MASASAGDREAGIGDGTDDVLLVYDRECPACDFYCRRVRICSTAGRLRLVDARATSAVMDEISAAGLDIDQGMVVKTGGRLHYGSDAIYQLARMGDGADPFNGLNRLAFRSRAVAHVLYPGLRACRNLLLKLLGRTKINNLKIEGNDRF